MIHLVAFQDLESGIGHTIYSDGSIAVSLELIFPMISALNNFVEECTQDERGLVNASLEDIKIFLYAPEGEQNPLRYVFFTDIYDNNFYLTLKAVNIHKYLSPHISYEVFTLPADIKEKIIEIITYTQHFPRDNISPSLIDKMNAYINSLEQVKEAFFADFFVGDIDQGIVFTIKSNGDLTEKDSAELFAELISVFTFQEDEIWVSSPLNKTERKKLERKGITKINDYKEGWILKQLAGDKSDFWLVSYFYYKKDKEEAILARLNQFAEDLSNEISPYLPSRPF
ncbi:MAG: hypothetical protein ACTSQE_15980 [Candidatus Heimdallarchaeaceae archaeon]